MAFLFSLFFFVFSSTSWASSGRTVPGHRALRLPRCPGHDGLARLHVHRHAEAGPIKFFTNMMFPWRSEAGARHPRADRVSLEHHRPAVHSRRSSYMANMFAGHLLITVFIVATIYLFSPSVIGMLRIGLHQAS